MVSLTGMMEFLAKSKVAGVDGVVTTGSMAVTSSIGVVAEGSSVLTSIGGVLTSSGGVLTSSGDGGIVTASSGMVDKGCFVVPSGGAVKYASGIKVEGTSMSSTSGDMVTSTGGLTSSRGVVISGAKTPGIGMVTTNGGMASTSGGVVQSGGGVMAPDFPSDVEMEIAFTVFYKINKVKIGAELGLEGEDLKNELIRMWMDMEKSEKKKYHTNHIPKVKKENQLKKSFVPPKAKGKHPGRESCLKDPKMSNDHNGSNDLTKNVILKELNFYKNLGRAKVPRGTKQSTSEINLPISGLNVQPDTFHGASGPDTKDKQSAGHPSPMKVVPNSENSCKKPDTSPLKDRKESDTKDDSVARLHKNKQDKSDSEKTFQCVKKDFHRYFISILTK